MAQGEAAHIVPDDDGAGSQDGVERIAGEGGEQVDEGLGERSDEDRGRSDRGGSDPRGVESSGWLLGEGRHVSVALRSSRRRLGWNQRELASKAGLHQATIARLEAGADARFSAVVSALSACGLLIVAAPPAGAPSHWRVVPHPMDEARDTGGRRLPAHLPAYATTILPTYTLWKRMVRGENLFAERPPHWLFAREPWPVPPDPPDLSPPGTPGSP